MQYNDGTGTKSINLKLEYGFYLIVAKNIDSFSLICFVQAEFHFQ